MPSNRPGVRRTGALTRRSIRRADRPGPAQEATRDRLRYLRSPATWLAGILLTVATVTFQDVLIGTVKTVLALDSLPDRLSPRNAIEVVEVSDVKGFGAYLVRGDEEGRLAAVMKSGGSWGEMNRVDVGRSEWMVTLRGRAAQQVRITDIVPEVEGGRCSSPLTGSLVLDPSQGVEDIIPLLVTIDDPVPTVKAYPSKTNRTVEDAKPYFTGPKARHITLNQDESEAFIIQAHSKRGHCRWRYRIHYQVGGSTAEMVLSRPDGKPFEMTGQLPDAGRYTSVYERNFGCASAGAWITATGEEYARALRKNYGNLCPSLKD
jgi:hypothetical protein